MPQFQKERRAGAGASRRSAQSGAYRAARASRSSKAARPSVAGFGAGPVSLPDAEVLQAMFEMPGSAREAVVPPGLHPTNPALVRDPGLALPRVAVGRVLARAGPRADAERPAPARLRARRRVRRPAAATRSRRLRFPRAAGRGLLRRAYDTVWVEVARGGADDPGPRGNRPGAAAAGDVSSTGNAQPRRDATRTAARPGRSRVRVRARSGCPRSCRVRARGLGRSRLDPYFAVSASVARRHRDAADALRVPPRRTGLHGTEKVE